jgi:hypothetical protein
MGKRKRIARPAAFSSVRNGLSVVSVAGAFGLASTSLFFHLPQPFTALALSAIRFWYRGTKPGTLAALLASFVRSYFFEPEINTRVLYDLTLPTKVEAHE